MGATEEEHRKILIPFDPREGISLALAAERAGKSESTLRTWCVQHGLGSVEIHLEWMTAVAR